MGSYSMQPRSEMKGATRVLRQVMDNPRELEAFTDDGGDVDHG